MATKEHPPDDPLLEPGEAGDDWKQNPVTRRYCQAQRARYAVSMKQLYALAMVSTDPKVAAKAGQIAEQMAIIEVMGGKIA